MEGSIDPEPSVFWGLLEISKPQLDGYFIAHVLTIAVLLFFSALISGSEVAFFSLTEKELIKENGRYTKILALLQKPKKLLATILILNNMVNIAIVMLTAYISQEFFISAISDQDYAALATVVTFITTFIIVFFGEVIPKVYANQNNLIMAERMSGILKFFNVLFTPFSWFMISFTSIIERNIDKKKRALTKDDLNKALEITAENNISKEEKDILKGIINFSNITAKQIMRSRIDVAAFDSELSYHELMDRINKQGFSRYPVYEETIDHIIGLIYVKDFLAFTGEDENFDWKNYLHEAYFIPETKLIDDLLKDFQERKIHMAIVVDEYGGTSGVVTLEDVIEEIVGEINDEFDDDEVTYSRINNKSYIFEGKTSINDFCKILEIDQDFFEEVKGESESIGGLMLELFSKIPRVSDSVSFKNFDFTIQSVSTKRIKRVKVDIKNLEHDAA